jgi:hypothetical protein
MTVMATSLLRVVVAGAIAASTIGVAAPACSAFTAAEDSADGSTTSDAPNAEVDAGGVGDAPGADAAPLPIGDGSPGGSMGCLGVVNCERVVFVTSTMYTAAALGGIAGADALCAMAALGSTHPRVRGRTFQAWLSTRLQSADKRLPHGTGRYVRPGNERIADHWTDLTNGRNWAAINEDEIGNTVGAGSVWTGTDDKGSTLLPACNDWIAGSDPEGTRGDLSQFETAAWTRAGTSSCTSEAHLYCFEY